MKNYAQYRSNGTLWPAGKSILGLCAAWNHATNPSTFMSDNDHKKSNLYARAIKNRMKKLGFVFGIHYTELSNGTLFPLKTKTA